MANEEFSPISTAHPYTLIVMIDSTTFPRLVSIPLFQGISRGDFEDIASKIHFSFKTFHAGEEIVIADTPCQELVCTINGRFVHEKRSDDGSYTFREYSEKPQVLQPDRLFGRRPYYSTTVRAVSDAYVLMVPKNEVRDILFNFLTIHINYLNLVCSAKQNWESRMWKQLPNNVEERFLYFLLGRATRPAGRKELDIGMVDLANELVTTRLNVSKMLNELKEQNLLYLSRGRIEIPEIEKIILRQQQLRK